MDMSVWGMQMWVREIRRRNEKIAMRDQRRSITRMMTGRTKTISIWSVQDIFQTLAIAMFSGSTPMAVLN
jgi:hypothetical protein